jgi:hypothetical protein
MKRAVKAKDMPEVDEVERLRQVRRQIERECKTLDGLFVRLRELDRQYAARMARKRIPQRKKKA